MLATLIQDFGHGLRSLTKRKTFAVIAIITLALGVGANTAVFSIVNALLLRPYDFTDLDRLVLVRADGPRVTSEFRIAPADLADLQREGGGLLGAAGFRAHEANLTFNGEAAEPVLSYAVSPNFFGLTGVSAATGRLFADEEGQPGRDQVVIINDRLWKRRFASDPALIGKSIEVDGRTLAVVGIMPPGFDYPPATDLWIPLALSPQESAERDAQNRSTPTLQVLARLRPEVDLARAQAQLRSFAARLERQFPETHRQRSLHYLRLRDEQFAFGGPPFLMLQAAAAFILILAAANLLNLFLVRVIERQKELAARIALGAGARRLAQALIGEILPLLAIAACLAVLAATYGVVAIRDSLPVEYTKWIAGWNRIRVDRSVIAFTLAISALLGLAFVVCAAWKSSRTDVSAALKVGGRGSAPGSAGGKTLTALVLVQLIFATVLLACTGLMIKGFSGVTDLYAPLDAVHVVGMRISLPERDYAGDAAVRTFYRQLLQEVAALPGVDAVGAIANPPASNVDSPRAAFVREGQQGLAAAGERASADLQVVGADIFGALRMPLLSGRSFLPSDDERSIPVAVISRTLAAQFWAGENAIGQRIRLDGSAADAAWITIIGVAEDVKQNWWDAAPRPVIYSSYLQTPKRVLELEVRCSRDPTQLIPSLRDAVRRVDGSVSLASAQSLDGSIADSLAPLRILRTLMTLFGMFAAVLSAIGIYALLSHSVTVRTHEFGVRSAVGATRVDLLRLVFAQNLRFAALGVCLGLPIAFILSTTMRATLPGMVNFDAASFFGFALLLTIVAMAAGYGPARRATLVDPNDTLRSS